MQEWLIAVVSQHALLVYALIFILAPAQGPIISLTGGVLLRLGYFSFIPLYIALMAGDLVGDTVWYFIGKRFGLSFVRRFGKYFSLTEKAVATVERVFHKHKYPILFLSKVTNGFGLALVTLMTAGMVKIPFWRYLAANGTGQLIWSGFLIGVGYFFSHLYLQVNDVLGRVFIVALFLLLVAMFFGFSKYVRSRAEGIDI